jgi:hypothetical protein
VLVFMNTMNSDLLGGGTKKVKQTTYVKLFCKPEYLNIFKPEPLNKLSRCYKFVEMCYKRATY